MFKWIAGRQNTGYKKLKIFQFLNMDCYLLKYNEGDYIPLHTDPVPGRKHYRLNVILKKPIEGGELYFRDSPNQFYLEEQTSRIQLFRSDLVEHCVSEIKRGTRIVLTFGIAL
jgi:hypothetical protein